MFPSKEYIALCTKPEVAEKLSQGDPEGREEWEPREGDWFYNPSQDKVHLLTRNNTWFIGAPKRFIEHNIPLPTQRQLQEMIEERGYDWLLEVGALRDKDERYEAVLYGLCTKSTTAVKIRIGAPDPETALLRALLEVMEKEER